MTWQPLKVSHCHFSIIDGILQGQLREVSKQFTVQFFFLSKSILILHWSLGETQLGLDHPKSPIAGVLK
jgi:hypothetical protein